MGRGQAMESTVFPWCPHSASMVSPCCPQAVRSALEHPEPSSPCATITLTGCHPLSPCHPCGLSVSQPLVPSSHPTQESHVLVLLCPISCATSGTCPHVTPLRLDTLSYSIHKTGSSVPNPLLGVSPSLSPPQWGSQFPGTNGNEPMAYQWGQRHGERWSHSWGTLPNPLLIQPTCGDWSRIHPGAAPGLPLGHLQALWC